MLDSYEAKRTLLEVTSEYNMKEQCNQADDLSLKNVLGTICRVEEEMKKTLEPAWSLPPFPPSTAFGYLTFQMEK